MNYTELPYLKIKYAVQLRKERVEGLDNDRPYLGLEHIASGTGKLVNLGWENGDLPSELGEIGESLCTLFEPNDVLFGKLRPYLAKAWVTTFSGRCTTEFIVLIPRNIDPGYLKYHFLSQNLLNDISSASYGSKMPRTDWDFIGNQKIFFPKIDQQRRITSYLDRETARIDALIAAKERLLTLLTEKRQALITKAVTRGLNPNEKMKDSGVEWLGEVPAHWKVERAKWLFRERNKRSITGEEEMLTVSHITGITPRSEKNVNMFEAETSEGYKMVYKNDLVINTLWAWMGAMGISPLDGIVSPAYHVYEISKYLDPGYANAISRTPIFATEVTRYSKGVWSSRLRLYPEGLYEVLFPVPPIEEQRVITIYIEKECSKIENLLSLTENSVILLKERRSALISAAVAGQLEIKSHES